MTGDIIYKLKKTWTDGTTAVIFSPLEFLEKLISLVFALDMDNCELCGGQMKAPQKVPLSKKSS